MPDDNTRELQRWKARVIEHMQDKSKHLEKEFVTSKHAPLDWLPEALFGVANSPLATVTSSDAVTDNGWVCDAMFKQRPVSAKSVGNCGPNYNSWQTFQTHFGT